MTRILIFSQFFCASIETKKKQLFIDQTRRNGGERKIKLRHNSKRARILVYCVCSRFLYSNFKLSEVGGLRVQYRTTVSHVNYCFKTKRHLLKYRAGVVIQTTVGRWVLYPFHLSNRPKAEVEDSVRGCFFVLLVNSFSRHSLNRILVTALRL